jgi:prepilin-type N-terminal cleavage/methylation domain-containing protein
MEEDMNKLQVDCGSGGFTLIEVLIASVLLAVLLIGVGLFFTNIIKQSDVVDDRTRAMEIARQGLEEIRTQDILSLPLGQSPIDTLEKFRRYYMVSGADSVYANSRLVECYVYWTDATGQDTLSFSTIF